jgi:hypothetical protein
MGKKWQYSNDSDGIIDTQIVAPVIDKNQVVYYFYKKTNTSLMAFVGVTVDELAIVGAAADVANTSVNFGEVNVGVVSVDVLIVGEVANTADPVPVSSVKAVRKLADVGVAKKVATLVPRPATPVEIGSPVQLVNTPEAGVPRAGVINVGDV